MKFLFAQTTPAALPAGNTNDYYPANLELITHLRQATNAAGSTLTGLLAQVDLDLRVVANLGPGNLTLNHEDTSSTAANRFTLPGGLPYTLSPGGSIMLAYDMPSSRWLVWAGQAQPSTLAAQENTLVYGDGSDGNVTISVDTTLARNMFYNNLTVNSGITLTCAGFVVCVKGTLTLIGKIAADGNPGATGGLSTNAGGTAAATNFLGGSGGGGQGGSGSGATAAGSSRAPRTFITAPIGSVSAGTPGTDGGIGQGGGGGGGEAPGGTCTIGATVVQANGDIHDIFNAVNGGYIGRAVGANNFSGGSGGGGGGGESTTPRAGGGGGAGGGCVVVRASNLLGTGTVSANGGAGGAGSTGSALRVGGGGGGGGGIAILIYRFGIAPNTTGGVVVIANGGAGGSPANAGGRGGNGGAGIVITSIA